MQAEEQTYYHVISRPSIFPNEVEGPRPVPIRALAAVPNETNVIKYPALLGHE
jgi:hypothetical protein